MLNWNPSKTPANSFVSESIHLATCGESQEASINRQDVQTSQRTSQQTTLAPSSELLSVVPPHPQGIKPSGQVFLATGDIRKAAGDLSKLPDEILAQTIDYLDILSLLYVGSTCKALWAFSRLDESLWRSKFFECPITSSWWHGDWYSTVLISTALINPARLPRPMIDCTGLYSDHLYRPFMCSNIRLSPNPDDIPFYNRIPRISKPTAAEFEAEWVNKPFIAEQVIQEWPITKFWTWKSFKGMFKDVNFSCEGVNWPYETYEEYMSNNNDEVPLYLFDHDFVEKMALTARKSLSPFGHYWAPACFGKDYFDVFGAQRPDHRWLIVGPERSGSSFHKDPNGTSAWNAVIRGSKYWIMFPKAPPGVYTSKDQSEVTSPTSIAEWLLGFHAEARKMDGCLEGICREGEILHVPSGWYHLVVNLEPSIAITQNFVPRHFLPDALGFLKYKPEQVSGFRSDVKNPYRTFLLRLRERYPEILDEALKVMDKRQSPRKRKWHEVVQVETDNGEHNKSELNDKVQQWNDKAPKPNKTEECTKCCFSFCFGGDEGSDEEVP